MEKAQLVFVLAPAMGHLVSAVEVARLLLNRHDLLSITVLVLNHSSVNSGVRNYVESQRASSSTISNSLRFIDLPKDEHESFSFSSLAERQKPHVKEAVLKITQSESSIDSPQLAGFVIDMFYTPMIDVANEFGVPSYIFFTSSAASLGFMLYVQKIHDEEKFDPAEFKDSDSELPVPSLVNPLPARVMPSPMLSRKQLPSLLEMQEGPILDVRSDGRSNHQEIMQWLDDQPLSSVVFLCFGSMGSFGEDQVKEIACALEHSGYRFLWSLRRPPPPGLLVSPVTMRIHKKSCLKVSWIEQPRLKGDGVGSTKQQFNAFEMVIELGLAVEIKMDYRNDSGIIVNCDEIERGIKCLMEHDSEKRKKVKEMSERSRMALMDGGSSHFYLGNLITDVMDNLG
ncbi:hypothetical protein GH714_004967 [Hevea brasiliensis]|uniref:Anthocyanidin 3-O-glucosyltransferase n=1 Tax=Hevea brasiliensis TaxID=3981 RepID=A0A6A6KXQ1_HEVBR|nr:hypothetical protein GH714_004967 [Hevea brasiliensis]